jgi:hypothetical protein
MLGIYKTSTQRAKSEGAKSKEQRAKSEGKGQRVFHALRFALRALPFALCPFALCALRFALCPSLFSPSGVSMAFLGALPSQSVKICQTKERVVSR